MHHYLLLIILVMSLIINLLYRMLYNSFAAWKEFIVLKRNQRDALGKLHHSWNHQLLGIAFNRLQYQLCYHTLLFHF